MLVFVPFPTVCFSRFSWFKQKFNWETILKLLNPGLTCFFHSNPGCRGGGVDAFPPQFSFRAVTSTFLKPPSDKKIWLHIFWNNYFDYFSKTVMDPPKVLMQGKLIAVVYTLRTYWNQFSLGGICEQEYASVFARDPRRIKEFNFDNFDNSHNNFRWPE